MQVLWKAVPVGCGGGEEHWVCSSKVVSCFPTVSPWLPPFLGNEEKQKLSLFVCPSEGLEVITVIEA